MTIELTAVGGYNEVGRQCTAIKVNDEVFIVDMGLHLDHYINYSENEREDIHQRSIRGLRKAGAVPDWTSIKDWRGKVKGIILTHAHLDHIGAVPYMAHLFKCPVYGSPFTMALLKQLLKDKEMRIPNKLVTVKDRVKITDDVTCEFIHMTHSTADSRFIALHTPDGIVTVDNDYKLDKTPMLGPKPNFKRLKELQGKVVCHVAESLYAPHAGKTPSEAVAHQLLEGVLLDAGFQNRTVFVSTFSSHISRLKSLMDIGKAMGRKVVFLGRSMSKYLEAAKQAKIISIPRHVRLIKYSSQIKRFFRKHKDLEKFLIVCTGHMGEPKAALSKLVDGKYPFRFKPDDVVVFSSRVIPVASIVAAREELERKFKDAHVRFYTDVHISGHASSEDIRELLTTIQPRHVVPNHGTPEMTNDFIEIAKDAKIKFIHNMQEGERVTIVD